MMTGMSSCFKDRNWVEWQLAVSMAASSCPCGSRSRRCPVSPMEAHEGEDIPVSVCTSGPGGHGMLSQSERDVVPSCLWVPYRRLSPRPAVSFSSLGKVFYPILQMGTLTA